MVHKVTRYVCEYCGKDDFSDEDSALDHERELMDNIRDPIFNVGDRVWYNESFYGKGFLCEITELAGIDKQTHHNRYRVRNDRSGYTHNFREDKLTKVEHEEPAPAISTR